MSDLLPCPFCNGKGEPHAEEGHVWIECESCGATTPAFWKSFEKAIAAWNRRSSASEGGFTAEEREALEFLLDDNDGWIDCGIKSLADPEWASACANPEQVRSEEREDIGRRQRYARILRRLASSGREAPGEVGEAGEAGK